MITVAEQAVIHSQSIQKLFRFLLLVFNINRSQILGAFVLFITSSELKYFDGVIRNKRFTQIFDFRELNSGV